LAITANLVVTRGHADVVAGGIGLLGTNLAGDGFTFESVVAIAFFNNFVPLAPGTFVTPSFPSGAINGASVTVLGVHYTGNPNSLRPTISGNFGDFHFLTGLLLPPAHAGEVVALTAPFVLNPGGFGSFIDITCQGAGTLPNPPCGNNQEQETLDLRLSGQGTGSISLLSGPETWFVQDLHFDFTAGPPPDPTLTVSPEPATLLLLGSSICSLLFAQARRRRCNTLQER
jgi:hypothetical protein